MVTSGPPAAGMGFNNFQEIKSHSSILYNQRMAILFYLLDMESIKMNISRTPDTIIRVRSYIKQIYKNVRTLIRNNPTMRATLNLETKDDGIYITDVAMGMIDQMILYCENDEFTTRRLYIISEELNKIEMLIKDILQYYHYFIRPDFRQKPDVDGATDQYKRFVDSRTVEELKQIAGKRNFIDFESLGRTKIDVSPKNVIEHDVEVDDELSDEEKEMLD